MTGPKREEERCDGQPRKQKVHPLNRREQNEVQRKKSNSASSSRKRTLTVAERNISKTCGGLIRMPRNQPQTQDDCDFRPAITFPPNPTTDIPDAHSSLIRGAVLR